MTKLFLKKIITSIREKKVILFLDESSFSNSSYCLKTWNNKKRSIQILDPGRIQSVSLIVAACEKGIIWWKINENTNKSTDFIDFLTNLNRKIEEDDGLLALKKEKRIILLMDNAKIHRTKEVRAFIRSTGLSAIYNVPYSPWLNMAENVFAILKSKFYSRLHKSK